MKRIIAMLLCAVLLIGGAYASDLKSPTGLYAGSSAVLVADSAQNAIYSLGADGQPVLYAGKINPDDIYGEPAGGYLDGEALAAQFDTPWDVVAFGDGYVVSDSGNNCIRYISGGQVTTLAGDTVAGLKNGKGTAARFSSPRGLAVDDAGVLYVADTLNNCIRVIDKTEGAFTFAGSAAEGNADGSLLDACFNGPTGLCWFGGALYVADTGNHAVRKIENGQVTTIVGQNSGVYEGSTELAGGFADGWAEAALLSSPADVAADENGIYIADTGNSALRLLDNDGWVTTFTAVEDGSALAQPSGVEIYDGVLYITDKFTGELLYGAYYTADSYFSDVPANSWFMPYVDFAVSNSLFKGVSDSVFDPNGFMQRGMIAAVLGRAAQIPDRSLILYGEKTFSDVPADAYYAAALSWAADKGIISGTGDGSFNPAGNATRQDTVTMLYRLAKAMGRDITKAADLSAFADSGEVASYAQSAMQWAVANGIIGGNELKQLLPTAQITRAQAAKIFCEFAKLK